MVDERVSKRSENFKETQVEATSAVEWEIPQVRIEEKYTIELSRSGYENEVTLAAQRALRLTKRRI